MTENALGGGKEEEMWEGRQIPLADSYRRTKQAINRRLWRYIRQIDGWMTTVRYLRPHPSFSFFIGR